MGLSDIFSTGHNLEPSFSKFYICLTDTRLRSS
nr:MAG TPA: hypothetical protein [Caudoviricetes sp.]